MHFISPRVINEDRRVALHTDFGTHGHPEFETFTYVVSGELEQRVYVTLCVKIVHNTNGNHLGSDSIGNREVFECEDLQMTTAGTSTRHSRKAHV